MNKGMLSLVLAGLVASFGTNASAASMQLQSVVQSVNMSAATGLQQAILAAAGKLSVSTVDLSQEEEAAIKRELTDLATLKLSNNTQLSQLQIAITAELFAPCAVLIAQGAISTSFDFSGIVVQYLETADTKDEAVVTLAWTKATEAIAKLESAMAKLGKKLDAAAATKSMEAVFRGIFTADERDRCKGEAACLRDAPGKGTARAAAFKQHCS